MVSIDGLLAELDERSIAKRIGIPHDTARMQYTLRSITVDRFDEFDRILGDYYNHHYAQCVSGGGALSPGDARSRAKQIITNDYRRRGRDLNTAFLDAREGTNGGLRGHLDVIAEALKTESVQHHTRDVFDRYVSPVSWEDQVEIIGQFLQRHGGLFGGSIDVGQPERYARDYEQLIREFVQALQRTSSVFRRL